MTYRTARVLRALLLLLAVSVAPSSVLGQEADSRALLLEAQQLVQRKKPQEAIALFKKADAAAGGACHECQLGLLGALNAAGAYKNAVEVAEALIKANPPSPMLRQAYAGLGSAYVAKATEDATALPLAEQAYRKALELPDSTAACDRFGLGVVLLKMNRDAEGASELAACLKAEPEGHHAADAKQLIERPVCARRECAPAFSSVTTTGEYLNADAFKGKVTLLHFWYVTDDWGRRWPALWPELRRLANRAEKEPLQIIGIGREPRQQSALEFIVASKMSWPQCLDQAPALYRAFGVDFMPTQIVVDHEGMVVHRSVYWSDERYGEINRAVSKALSELKKAKGKGE